MVVAEVVEVVPELAKLSGQLPRAADLIKREAELLQKLEDVSISVCTWVMQPWSGNAQWFMVDNTLTIMKGH